MEGYVSTGFKVLFSKQKYTDLGKQRFYDFFKQSSGTDFCKTFKEEDGYKYLDPFKDKEMDLILYEVQQNNSGSDFVYWLCKDEKMIYASDVFTLFYFTKNNLIKNGMVKAKFNMWSYSNKNFIRVSI